MGRGSALGNLYFGSLGRNELFEDKTDVKEFHDRTLDSLPRFSRMFGWFSRMFGCDRLPWQCDLQILGLLVLIGLFKAAKGAQSLILTFKSLASILWLFNLLTDGFGLTHLETWKC